MTELSINTPALLFPAITLLMLAYTNRFLALANRARSLHDKYVNGNQHKIVLAQIKNLRSRLNLIRYMQGFGVLSFLCCVLCMYIIFRGWMGLAHGVFAASLILLIVSIILSLIEIFQSTRAIELELSDMEELNGGNIFSDIFSKKDSD